MNEQFYNTASTTIPIIEDAETLVETTVETLIETCGENTHVPSLINQPYLERLDLQKFIEKPCFNIPGELKKLHVKIPLLKYLHDVPIYAKNFRDLCVKKPCRKLKYHLTILLVGKLSELMMGKTPLAKYDYPRNPTITVQIGKTHIPNVLVDLGIAINVMTIEIV